MVNKRSRLHRLQVMQNLRELAITSREVESKYGERDIPVRVLFAQRAQRLEI